MRPELIQELVKKLAKYYNYEVSEVDYEFWFDVFYDCSEEEFKHAGREFIKTGAKFMPKAGELYQIVAKERDAKRLKYMPVVQEVVSEIRGSLNSYAPMPKYSHPLIDDLVRRLGYQRLCENTSAENQRLITFAAKEMIEHEIDSGSDQYTAEAESRAIASEQKKIGNGGGKMLQ